ncbi:MAG: class II glutamine amidotransferase [Syntrophomonadaceae bacterium]
MCELLGISSNRKSNIQFSSQAMQANSRTHSHGWGVAFYPEESGFCQVIKEPRAMKNSHLFEYLRKEDVISSNIILNHIRLAAGGSKTYENTHPFTRELFGQDWVLIHNGAEGMDNYYRQYIKRTKKQDFTPIGTTGSDKALCIVLNELKNRLPIDRNLVEEGSSLRVKITYDFEQAQRVIYNVCRQIQNSGANLNILLSNGEYLVAFHSGYNHLHYVLRDGRVFNSGNVTINAEAKRYFNNIGQAASSLQKPSNEKAAIVATEILTVGEEWQAFTKGDFLVFKNGCLAFINGKKESGSDAQFCIEKVEVYDTSVRMDSLGADVIGVSKQLRDKLAIRVGDNVQVRKHGADISVVLSVHQTDRRLLKGASCAADNVNSHVCIPRQVRNTLGLVAEQSSHRRGLDAYSSKYSPVDLFKI